jgi:predicted MFS family arabinose efflux permease
VLAGGIRLWQVVACGLAFGVLSAVDNPARQAFVPEMVGRGLVRNAVTLNSTSVNVARVLGPAGAAVLVSRIGIGWCFVVNAGSFAFVIASLLSLDARGLHPAPGVSRERGQLRAGLRYAAQVPDIAVPLLMMALIGTFTFEFEVSLPLLAQFTFHGGDRGNSWLIGALGAGAVLGGLHAARSAKTGVPRLRKAAFGYAVAVGLLAAAPVFLAAVAACALVGLASVIFLTRGNSTVQLASEPAYRGRVTALWSMALVGSTPVGSAVIGALSDAAGLRYALALGPPPASSPSYRHLVALDSLPWPAPPPGSRASPRPYGDLSHSPAPTACLSRPFGFLPGHGESDGGPRPFRAREERQPTLAGDGASARTVSSPRSVAAPGNIIRRITRCCCRARRRADWPEGRLAPSLAPSRQIPWSERGKSCDPLPRNAAGPGKREISL